MNIRSAYGISLIWLGVSIISWVF